MRIVNKTKRLIVVNGLDGKKARFSLQIPAGETKEHEDLVESDVSHYVNKKALEIVATTPAKEKKVVVPVVLPEEKTAETLKAMASKDLRRYCKENKITVPPKTDEDGVIALILDSLEPKE